MGFQEFLDSYVGEGQQDDQQQKPAQQAATSPSFDKFLKDYTNNTGKVAADGSATTVDFGNFGKPKGQPLERAPQNEGPQVAEQAPTVTAQPIQLPKPAPAGQDLKQAEDYVNQSIQDINAGKRIKTANLDTFISPESVMKLPPEQRQQVLQHYSELQGKLDAALQKRMAGYAGPGGVSVPPDKTWGDILEEHPLAALNDEWKEAREGSAYYDPTTDSLSLKKVLTNGSPQDAAVATTYAHLIGTMTGAKNEDQAFANAQAVIDTFDDSISVGTGVVQGLSTPENLGLMFAMEAKVPGAISKSASALFGVQMAGGAKEKIKLAKELWDNGHQREAGRMFASAMVDTIFAAGSAEHLFSGKTPIEKEQELQQREGQYVARGESQGSAVGTFQGDNAALASQEGGNTAQLAAQLDLQKAQESPITLQHNPDGTISIKLPPGVIRPAQVTPAEDVRDKQQKAPQSLHEAAQEAAKNGYRVEAQTPETTPIKTPEELSAEQQRPQVKANLGDIGETNQAPAPERPPLPASAKRSERPRDINGQPVGMDAERVSQNAKDAHYPVYDRDANSGTLPSGWLSPDGSVGIGHDIHESPDTMAQKLTGDKQGDWRVSERGLINSGWVKKQTEGVYQVEKLSSDKLAVIQDDLNRPGSLPQGRDIFIGTATREIHIPREQYEGMYGRNLEAAIRGKLRERGVGEPEQDQYLNQPVEKPKGQPGMEQRQGFTPKAKMAEPFYSKAERVAEAKLPARMTGEQAIATLRNNGVSPLEIGELGLEDAFNGKNVTKQEFLDYIRRNKPQLTITETKQGEGSNGILGNEPDLHDLMQEQGQIRIDLERTEREIDGIHSRLMESVPAEHRQKMGGLRPVYMLEEIEKLIDDSARANRTMLMPEVRDSQPYKEALEFFPDRKLLDEYLDTYIDIANLSAEDQRLSTRIGGNDGEEYGGTRFSHWTLPGGTNYREIKIRVPSKSERAMSDMEAVKGSKNLDDTVRMAQERFDRDKKLSEDYYGPHFDEPNIIVHFRVKDRVTPDGKKVLYIEEIQSDLHQQGKRYGYFYGPRVRFKSWDDAKAAGYKIKTSYSEDGAAHSLYNKNGDFIVDLSPSNRHEAYLPLEERALRSVNEFITHGRDMVPGHPFRTNWHELALKRLIRMAAEDGYDKVAWANGAEQLKRYPGAEGQAGKTFYDKVIPRFLEKYTKKWGGNVGETELDIPRTNGKDVGHGVRGPDGKMTYFGDEKQARDFALAHGGEYTGPVYDRTKHPSLDITPEMRSSVMEHGQPLYKIGHSEEPVDISDQVRSVEYKPGEGGRPGQVLIGTPFANWFHAISDSLVRKLKDAPQSLKESVRVPIGSWSGVTVDPFTIRDHFFKEMLDDVLNSRRNAFGAKEAAEKAEWLRQLTTAVKDAITRGEHGLILTRNSGITGDMMRVASHESLHVIQNGWQDFLDRGFNNGDFKGMERIDHVLAHDPDTLEMVRALHDTYGYDASKHTAWAEVPAYIMDGWDGFNVPVERQMAWLEKYLTAVVEAHGSRQPLLDLRDKLIRDDAFQTQSPQFEKALSNVETKYAGSTRVPASEQIRSQRAREYFSSIRGESFPPARRVSGGENAGGEGAPDDRGVQRDLSENGRIPPPLRGREAAGAPGLRRNPGEAGFTRPDFVPEVVRGLVGGEKPPVRATTTIGKITERQLADTGERPSIFKEKGFKEGFKALYRGANQTLVDRFAQWRGAVADMRKRGVVLPIDKDPGAVFDLVYGGASGPIEAKLLDLRDITKAAERDKVLNTGNPDTEYLRNYLTLRGYERAFYINEQRMNEALDTAKYYEDQLNGPITNPDVIAELQQNASAARELAKEYAEKAKNGKLVGKDFETVNDVVSAIYQLEKAMGNENYAKVLGHADKIWDISREAWDAAYKNGIISKKVYDQGLTRGKEYIPLERLSEETYGASTAAGFAQPSIDLKQQKYLFKFSGSDRTTVEPIGATFSKYAEVMREIDRSNAAKTAVLALEKDTAPGGFNDPENPLIHMMKGGERVENLKREGYGVISFYHDGKRVNYAIPDQLASTLKLSSPKLTDVLERVITDPRMREIVTGTINKVLGGTKKIAQGAYTSTNLAFAIPNVIRDHKDLLLLSKVIESKNPLVAAKDFAVFEGKFLMNAGRILAEHSGLTSRFDNRLLRDAKEKYRDFLRSRAAYATMQRNVTPEAFLREGKNEPFGNYLGTGYIVDSIEKLNNAFEEATKMSAYQMLRERGWSKDAAAVEVRRNAGSPDFAAGGELKDALNTAFLFFNPRLQGARRAIKQGFGFKESPALMFSIMAASAYLAHYNSQFVDKDGKREMDKIQQSTNQNYWVVLLPIQYQTAKGDYRYFPIKIPKSHLEQVIVNPVQDLIMSKLYGYNKTTKQSLLDAASNMLPWNMNLEENEVGSSAWRGLMASAHPVVRESYEQLRGPGGEDDYTNTPIVPVRQTGMLPMEQKYPSTWGIAKKASELLDKYADIEWSPARIQHAMRTFTGGLGESFASIPEAMTNNEYRSLLEGPEAVTHAPVAGPFLARFLGAGGNEIERREGQLFYKHYNRFQDVSKTIANNEVPAKEKVKLLDDPSVAFYYMPIKGQEDAMTYGEAINDVARQLSQLRQATAAWEQSKLPVPQRKAKLAELRQQYMELLHAGQLIDDDYQSFAKAYPQKKGEIIKQLTEAE